MAPRERKTVLIAGHEIPITTTAEESRHIERATKAVNEQMGALQGRAGSIITPARAALMVAFQNAFDLSVAEEQLSEAAVLKADLDRQKDATARLEGLLGKVDDALTY